MPDMHPRHDDRLLDALDELERHSFDGRCWRIVREGRGVLDGSRGSGRWNPSDLSVLYTALEPDGAMAEIHFHISRNQPLFPSRIRHELCELSTQTEQTLILADMDELVSLGVEQDRYKQILYTQTQRIAAAAAFMGFDGIIAPSARHASNNLVLFLDNYSLENIEVVSKTKVDWIDWRYKNIKSS